MHGTGEARGEPADRAPGSVRSSLFWASFGQAAFFILQFGSTVVLARLLSPREQGVFAIGVATVGLISIVQALGLNNYLIRAERIDRPMLSAVFTINLILSVALSIGIVALGSLSTHMFKEPGTNRVMLWLAVTPLVGAIGLVPTSLLQREGDFRALSVLKTASTLAGTALTVALAFAHYSYMSLAYGWVLTCTVNALGACLIAPRHVHARFGLAGWREISTFGTRMILINGTVSMQRQLLNLVLGRFLGLAAVGLFARANNLFGLLYENIQTVVARVFLVDFAHAARSGEPLRDRYRAVIGMLTALLWPLFAGLAVLSGPVVHLLYGAMWLEIALPLSLLCITGILWIAVAMAWELFVVANETKMQARLEVIRAAIGVVLWVAACRFSLDAAVATRIAESAVAVFLYRPHIERIAGIRRGELMPVYLRSAGLTAVAVLPAAAVMVAYRWSPLAPLVPVFLSVAAGVALYVAALLLTRHPLADELKRLARRRRVAQPAA